MLFSVLFLFTTVQLQNCSLTNITSATPGNDTCQVSKLGMSFTCGTDLPRYASFNGYQGEIVLLDIVEVQLDAAQLCPSIV